MVRREIIASSSARLALTTSCRRMPASTTCLRPASNAVDAGIRRPDGSDNPTHGERFRLPCVEPLPRCTILTGERIDRSSDGRMAGITSLVTPEAVSDRPKSYTATSKKGFHHEVSQRPAGGRTAMDENAPAWVPPRSPPKAIYVVVDTKQQELSALRAASVHTREAHQYFFVFFVFFVSSW